jgi:hypothetical protein
LPAFLDWQPVEKWARINNRETNLRGKGPRIQSVREVNTAESPQAKPDRLPPPASLTERQ